MTFEKLRKLGLKKLYLKNSEDIECVKWELIGRFNLLTKDKSNFKDVRDVDIKIFYYDDVHCYVEIECTKSEFNKNTFITIQEIIEYQYFFTHIFDVDEYVIQ